MEERYEQFLKKTEVSIERDRQMRKLESQTFDHRYQPKNYVAPLRGSSPHKDSYTRLDDKPKDTFDYVRLSYAEPLKPSKSRDPNRVSLDFQRPNFDQYRHQAPVETEQSFRPTEYKPDDYENTLSPEEKNPRTSKDELLKQLFEEQKQIRDRIQKITEDERSKTPPPPMKNWLSMKKETNYNKYENEQEDKYQKLLEKDKEIIRKFENQTSKALYDQADYTTFMKDREPLGENQRNQVYP